MARRWRNSPAYRGLTTAFAGVAPEDAAGLADAATGALGDVGWLDDLFTPLVAALRSDPWFEPPLRCNRDRARSGAILFEQPGISISLSTMSAAALTGVVPRTIVCSGRLVITRYLRAGGARLACWGAAPLPVPLIAEAITPCHRLPDRLIAHRAMVRHDGRAGAEVVVAADRDVVMLSAAVNAGADAVAREYDVETGRFVRMATSDEGAARAQLLLGFLRAAGRAEPEVFDAATRDGAFFLRWSVMREWLACDWRGARSRLDEMATGDPHPEVRATAAATLARLNSATP